MHSYLRSIGFSDIHSIMQLNKIVVDIVRSYDEKIIYEMSDGRCLGEITKEYGDGFGLTIVGEYDGKEKFFPEYVFPYFMGYHEGSGEDVIIERHVASDSYSGACDDLRVGTTLIFFLVNAGDYLSGSYRNNDLIQGKKTVFSALSKEGMVLLPVEKSEEYSQPLPSDNYHKLMEAARNGDEDAIEDLTIEDYDTYSMLFKRVEKEDVLSIVDNYFMPNGSECECYSILGNILDWEEIKNNYTGESIVRIVVECNDIRMDIGINRKDLVGEPEAGRRFKGNIWLMGRIYFED